MSSAQELIAEPIPQEIPFNINAVMWSRLSSARKNYFMNLHQKILIQQKRYNIDHNYLQYIGSLQFKFSYKHNNKIYKHLKESLMTYAHVSEYKGNGKYTMSILL